MKQDTKKLLKRFALLAGELALVPLSFRLGGVLVCLGLNL